MRFQRHSHDGQARLRGISASAQRAELLEGQTIVLEVRERMPGLLAELVGLKVDVVVVTNSEATRAAMKATRTIPIVMFATDPVRQGLVTSLSHPGGNVTGLSYFNEELGGKRLQLLRELVDYAAIILVILPRCMSLNVAQDGHAGLERASPLLVVTQTRSGLKVAAWRVRQDQRELSEIAGLSFGPRYGAGFQPTRFTIGGGFRVSGWASRLQTKPDRQGHLSSPSLRRSRTVGGRRFEHGRHTLWT